MHLLRKGIKGAKASVFVDAAMGFVALRDDLDHCVLTSGDNTLTQELVPHRVNVLHRRRQLATFAQSVQRGTVGRFEAVFDCEGLDPNLIGRVVEPNLMSRFQRLLSITLRLQIIAVSTDNWWRVQNLNQFIREILNPFLTVCHKADSCLGEIDFLRPIYDLEVIVYYWAMGRGNNRLVDTNRLSLLIRATENTTKQLPFNRPKIQQREPSMPLDHSWLDKELIQRHGYVKTVANHIAFILETREVPCRIGNKIKIFSSILKFWAVYCANSWNLKSILTKKKSASVLDVFAIETLLAQKTANSYKRENKPRSISINKQQLSYLTVYENILWPDSLIGQMILNIHVPDRPTLNALRNDENIRNQCLDYVKNNVKYFPSKMVNPTLPTDCPLTVVYWFSWAPINDKITCDKNIRRNGLTMGADKRFHPYKRIALLNSSATTGNGIRVSQTTLKK